MCCERALQATLTSGLVCANYPQCAMAGKLKVPGFLGQFNAVSFRSSLDKSWRC